METSSNPSDKVILAIVAKDRSKLEAVLADGSYRHLSSVGQVALVEAAAQGWVDGVQMLLAAGADVDQQDAGRYTALIRAAEQGNLAVCQRLLAAGADPNLRKGTAVSALSKAVSFRTAQHFSVVTALLAAGADFNAPLRSQAGNPAGTVLRNAAVAGNTEAVRELLARGADVNAVVSFGTALTAAAEEGAADIVQILLAAGADPSIRLAKDARLGAKAGKSAEELARAGRHVRVARMLSGGGDAVAATRPGDVAHAWKRLEASLAAQPKIMRTLCDGAPTTSIEVAERGWKKALPVEWRLFWSIHDGQMETPEAYFIDTGDPLDSGFRLLGVTEALREWGVWERMLQAGQFKGLKAQPHPGVSEDWFNPGWIPVSTNGQGDSHCIDLAPASGGRPGQVILLRHDEPVRGVVADSLVEWLVSISGIPSGS